MTKWLVAALAAGLVLTGCVGGANNPATKTPSPTPTVTLSPTPSGTPVDPVTAYCLRGDPQAAPPDVSNAIGFCGRISYTGSFVPLQTQVVAVINGRRCLNERRPSAPDISWYVIIFPAQPEPGKPQACGAPVNPGEKVTFEVTGFAGARQFDFQVTQASVAVRPGLQIANLIVK